MRRMMSAALGIALLLGSQTAMASLRPEIKIHPHVDTATYAKPLHDVKGRVGIVNGTNKTITIRCTVVATLHAKGGTAVLLGSAIIKTSVGPQRTKMAHYEIFVRDKHHKYRNSPSHLGAQCSEV